MNSTNTRVPTRPRIEKWRQAQTGRVLQLDLDQPEAAVVVLRDELIHAGYTLIEPAPEASPLDWFAYDLSDDIETYTLPSEMTTNGHFVHKALNDTVWTIMPVDAPNGSMTVMETITYTEELRRCITACTYLNARTAVAL